MRPAIEPQQPVTDDPFMSLRQLAAYSGMSLRTLQRHCAGVSGSVLPHYRPAGGKVFVRKSEFDSWMAQWRRDTVPMALRVRPSRLGH